MSKLMTYTRKCEDCGAEMKNVGSTRRFCDACRRRRDSIRLIRKALREKGNLDDAPGELPPQRASYQKPTKANSIEAVCARANAAGRTYGQQVEYERRQKELRDRGEID